MRQFGGFLSVLIVMSAFSGCFGDGQTKAADDGDIEGSAVPIESNKTASATNVLAVIAVSIDGNVSKAVNGSIPAEAGSNVTFDGSTSTGDNLTFAWDFGGNATGTNSSETHAFSDAGLFNVTLTVTSGNETDTASVLVNVTSAGPGPGELVTTAVHDFTGTLLVGDPNSDTAPIGGANSIRTHAVPILDQTEDGVSVVAKTARLTLTTSSASALIVNLQWRDPGGAIVARGDSNYQGGEMKNDHEIVFEGPMVAGDWGGFVRHMVGANAQYTLHVEIDYYSA